MATGLRQNIVQVHQDEAISGSNPVTIGYSDHYSNTSIINKRGGFVWCFISGLERWMQKESERGIDYFSAV